MESNGGIERWNLLCNLLWNGTVATSDGSERWNEGWKRAVEWNGEIERRNLLESAVESSDGANGAIKRWN